ncbi:MBL fold metallo-hydrolase [Jeotgalibacillus terrae]|uniref:Metallo-beta-lactamase domain-containing protein n=1 Tax=Jeotgalibacillus terrae TaxID=587735 RepID=A0ABW5ZKF5_9BACL|nr:hypothetical protein [Jeotgalibacillus terrae]MBM7578157.1 glyoxylase-like metal-dependent hydrolase (beta-lactamase superfamily II) [Jeotgalibacillus terrae]
MEKSICITCGTQYPPSSQQPECCVICEEERQYVHPDGQQWTTLEDMQLSGTYTNEFIDEQSGLQSITTQPSFGIGQTAYLIEERGFRLLWDCIAYIDEKTVNDIKEEGGIDAIALSHPHYYTTQVEWAEAFECPIYIHEDDRQWVQRPSDRIIFWSGESLQISEGLVLYRLGGHFDGGAVLHWSKQSDNDAVLLTGDIIQVAAAREWVSFMYSYPNMIPLPAKAVKTIAEKLKPLAFGELYNAFHREVSGPADAAVQKSAERYIAALEGRLF